MPRCAWGKVLPVVFAPLALAGCAVAQDFDVAAVPVTSSAPSGPTQAQIDECVRLSIADLRDFRRITHEEAVGEFHQIYDVDAVYGEVVDGGWLVAIPGYDEPEGVRPTYCEVIGAQITPITSAELDAKGSLVD